MVDMRLTLPARRIARSGSLNPRRLFVATLAISAFAAGDAMAQEAISLSLETAVARALDANPGFRAVRNDVALADWEVRSARGNLTLPSVGVNGGISWQGSGEERIGGLTAGELGVGRQSDFLFSNYGVGVSYSVSGPGLRAPALAQASRQAAEARVVQARTDLILRVTQAWLELARQREGMTLAERQLDRARINERLAESRAAVGLATPLDARQARLQVGRASLAVDDAREGIRSARITLLQWMGESEDREVIPETSSLALQTTPLDRTALLNDALRAAPALETLRAGLGVAQRRVASAQASYLPSLQVSAGWSGFTRQARDEAFLLGQLETRLAAQEAQCEFQNELFRRLANPLPLADCTGFALTPDLSAQVLDGNRQFPFDFTRQPPQASFSLSIPVFQGVERRRQVEVARIEVESAQLRLREAEIALRADLAALVTAVERAEALALLEAENQEVAEALLRQARDRYEEGEGTFVQVVEAEAVAAQADRDHLEARFRYLDALARLEALTGQSQRSP
jgi:outer membrane protein TolC